MTWLKRHDLVWLQESAWQNLIKAQTLEVQELLGQWPKNDWPAVVCRDEIHLHKNKVAIGISLLGSQNKKIRISGFVQLHEILKHQNALKLRDTYSEAPLRWQEPLKKLLESAHEFSVFGSLSWQALTKKSYVNDSSDIDLLYRPSHQTDLDGALAIWNEFSQWLPLDGEIEFQSGEAVSFREWQKSERVLCKNLTEVSLRSRQELTDSLAKSL